MDFLHLGDELLKLKWNISCSMLSYEILCKDCEKYGVQRKNVSVKYLKPPLGSLYCLQLSTPWDWPT